MNNEIVTQDVPKAPQLTELIAAYNVFAAPIASVVVGSTSAALDRDGHHRPASPRSAGSSPMRSSRRRSVQGHSSRS